jgi:general secretion pathway protein E
VLVRDGAPGSGVAALIERLRADPVSSRAVDWSRLDRDGGSAWVSYHEIWSSSAMRAADLADAVAALHGLPRTPAAGIAADDRLLSGLSRKYLRDAWILPFRGDEGALLAVADPTRTEEIEAVRVALGSKAPLVVASFDELAAWFESSGRQVPPPIEPDVPMDGSAGDETLERLQDLASGRPVIQAVDSLLDAAVGLSATDIHIEPMGRGVQVRMRVDGFLRVHGTLPSTMARATISRVKILSGLDIAETRLPQDGRTRMRVGGTEVDLRVATMPTLHGEAAVIRILATDARMLDVAHLGLSPRDQESFVGQLAQPHGLIVVAGPTGSGKTTTLAAALSRLNRPERKIMTIEDPVEYQIPGVHQTQIKPAIDLTFASALRSFLRHDPDILMVGEMRDRETAGIGIQAALTGHLVLTTLHTNTAAEAVIRLADLGVEDFLLASALRCVVGQRLVRRLCERCKVRGAEPPPAARRLVESGMMGAEAGRLLFAARGCDQCGQTGYRGRVAIFEVLTMDAGMRSLLRQRPDPVEVERQARRQGMTTMYEDGLRKCLDGITSIEEVVRATSVQEGVPEVRDHDPPS